MYFDSLALNPEVAPSHFLSQILLLEAVSHLSSSPLAYQNKVGVELLASLKIPVTDSPAAVQNV